MSFLAYIPIMMKLDVSAYPDVVNETKQAMSKIDLKAYPAVLNYVKQMSERLLQRALGQLTKFDPICCSKSWIKPLF